MNENNIENIKNFKELGINQWLIDTLCKISINQPTEVQSNCIPAILKGIN